jgi:hypothetical protein
MQNNADTLSQPKRESKLAHCSFVFSCGGLFVPIIPSIIGIICGHLALKEFKRNPELEGKQKAKWGLIIGYGYFVIVPLGAVAFVYLFGGICGGGLLTR